MSNDISDELDRDIVEQVRSYEYDAADEFYAEVPKTVLHEAANEIARLRMLIAEFEAQRLTR
jgi:hypothetical protein